MKIAICGSMMFAKNMKEISDLLIGKGHEVFVPEFTGDIVDGRQDIEKIKSEGHGEFKKKHDLIRKHWQVIQNSDAVLILNYNKNNIDNYIGGNSFLEMGFAHILNKKIYLLNPIPKMSYFDEMAAMEPVILNSDLDLIK